MGWSIEVMPDFGSVLVPGVGSGLQVHILCYILHYIVSYHTHRAIHRPMLRSCHEPRIL